MATRAIIYDDAGGDGSNRAVVYARVSGDDRMNEGRNLAGQIDMGRDYSEKRGYTVVAELPEDDRGASGAAFELPQLGKVLEMARAGKFDVLVVREIDRLSRNLAKQLIVEEELKREGVRIEYVIGEYPDTPEGDLMKNVRASIAEYERLKITERVTRGRRQKVKAGSVMLHGRAPYGYRAKTDGERVSLAIHEEEAHWIRQIFYWYIGADGEPIGPTAIARRLGELGVLTSSDKDPRFTKTQVSAWWNPVTIQRILKNQTYAGTWHYGKEAKREDYLLAVQVPAIITVEVWQAAEKQRKLNGARRPAQHEYLLSGRLRCGSCHFLMNPSAGGNSGGQRRCRYYHCHTKQKGVRYCADGASVRADLSDVAVWQWVKDLLQDGALIESKLEQQRQMHDAITAPLRARVTMIDELVASKRAEIERAADAYMAGDTVKSVLLKRVAQRETEIESLGRERADLMARIEQSTLTADQIRTLDDFRARMADGLAEADESFLERQRIVVVLDVKGTVTNAGRDKIIDVQCKLGTAKLSLSNTGTHKRRC